jgi:hypothetical protein
LEQAEKAGASSLSWDLRSPRLPLVVFFFGTGISKPPSQKQRMIYKKPAGTQEAGANQPLQNRTVKT